MNNHNGLKYLPGINSPSDLKKLSTDELKDVADELRQFLISTVYMTGGHLGSNLGTVELTLAMHYIYDLPTDQIVWDVGAQAYSHKILSGRFDKFHTNRQWGGIAGFPSRNESQYDSFGVGHSSTSISAALGVAEARDFVGDKYKVISVIGDGGLTGGLAFEGLNNAGASGKDISVIFNDNRMAISPNVGALSNLFSYIRTDLRFEKIKDNMWDLVGKLPRGPKLRKAIRGMDEGLKAMMMPGLWFERLGFRYVGPVNGHDLDELISMFKWLKKLSGPVVVHIITEKGKGYSPAESDFTKLHGVSKISPTKGKKETKVQAKEPELNFCQHFSNELLTLAENDDKIIAITPAMIEGSALGKMFEKFPDRSFDVGIAEQHALTFAAGLATQGMKPVVAIYSTFLQRAYDQLIHDICLQDLPVVLGIDRAGLVGEDGPTHHGSYDLTYLRHIPGLSILIPRDGSQLRAMLRSAVQEKSEPVAIRFPRGKPPEFNLEIEPSTEVWQPEYLREGKDGVIIGAGPILKSCMDVAETLQLDKKLSIAVLDIRCIKPLPIEYLLAAAKRYKKWVVVEENVLAGGLGSLLLEFISDNSLQIDVKRLGLPDKNIPHGDKENQLIYAGLDYGAILKATSEHLKRSRRLKIRKLGVSKVD